VMELAGLVREGYMSREEALDRLEVAAAPEVVAAVEAKLGIPPSRRIGNVGGSVGRPSPNVGDLRSTGGG